METWDSDYSSTELFIAAYLSGDKQLLFAIEQGMTFTVTLHF
jgi:DNA polymerase I-like protein with 3'-5' exonuclease and polymerase domains